MEDIQIIKLQNQSYMQKLQVQHTIRPHAYKDCVRLGCWDHIHT